MYRMRSSSTGTLLRRRCWVGAACLVAVASVATPALADDEQELQVAATVFAPYAPQAEEEGATFDIRWDQGLRLEALQKSFTLRIAGAAQNDSAAFSPSGIEAPGGTIENGVEWRRARLVAEGIFARHFGYKFQYDFAVNNPPNLKDAFLQFNLPVFPLIMRGGRFRAPVGLEGFTSGNDTTFLERGLINTFVPSRNTGALFITDAKRQGHAWRGAVGAVKPEDDIGIGSTDNIGFSGRFSYAFHPTAGDLLVHAGGNYMYRPVDETIRFLQRPEAHIAPVFTDTGDIEADSVKTAVAEFAVVKGPLSFQTEAAFTQVQRDSLGLSNPLFWGGYAFVSWFITGETRPYQDDRGNFGRLHPDNPFWSDAGRGLGALEVAFRFSYLNLEDKEIEGGRLADFTAAFNWYATRNARVMANLIRADASLVAEPVWVAQVRLQWAY